MYHFLKDEFTSESVTDLVKLGAKFWIRVDTNICSAQKTGSAEVFEAVRVD